MFTAATLADPSRIINHMDMRYQKAMSPTIQSVEALYSDRQSSVAQSQSFRRSARTGGKIDGHTGPDKMLVQSWTTRVSHGAQAASMLSKPSTKRTIPR